MLAAEIRNVTENNTPKIIVHVLNIAFGIFLNRLAMHTMTNGRTII